MAALPRSDVTLDRPCPSVKVLHRRWCDADLFFFFNEAEEAHSFQATLIASGSVQVWNAETGEIETLPDLALGTDATRVSLTLSPYESSFVLIGACQLETIKSRE
jgi:hypothetical protein